MHPVSTVLAGPVLYTSTTQPRCCSWYREFMPAAAGRAQRLLRVPLGSAGAAVPGGAAPAQGVRRRLVPGRRGGLAGAPRGACVRQAAPRRHRARAVPGVELGVRRRVSGRRPVVLARRLRERGPGRRDREARRVRARRCRRGSRRCTCTRSTALPSRVGERRDRLGVPRCGVVAGHRRRRPGSRERRRDQRLGEGVLRCRSAVHARRRLRRTSRWTSRIA